MQHLPWRAAALITALAASSMTLVACGDDSSTGSPASTGVTQVITISYTGGKIEGGGRKQVAKGSTVTLQVTSDIVDEVHLHGYDKAVNTVANQPVQIVFKADASGVFEVELEKKGLKLVDIEVK
ncbi:MAG: hypothetical protein F2754_10770 [Actinobacteria bacterium]|uniref:Unannotated protein n=1 Tax=freshwater metagenome TaxID=449393 RepID=A0A6J6T5X9_9ZZZZ|nr:hypothetical protein [Actinomycetota bacterium]MSX87858.1 hypothetical protein [Actinomycetota bacterium]MSY71572.1 hypothetical protein [Actinomycetota bacterium]